MTDILDPRQHRYGLGRIAAEDERDRAFPMAAVLQATPDAYPKRDRPWRLGPVLNQGSTSSCTGHASAYWLMAEPIRTMKGPDPYAIYDEAQKRDPWKNVQHDGSTVRAAMQYLQEAGHIASYLWATDVDTIADWLLRRGTVVCGTNWYRSMFTPDADHRIRIAGPAVGGHAWHLVWYYEKGGMFKLQNSWGVEWGDEGFALITGEDLQRLLREDGEAAAPVEQKVKPIRAKGGTDAE